MGKYFLIPVDFERFGPVADVLARRLRHADFHRFNYLRLDIQVLRATRLHLAIDSFGVPGHCQDHHRATD
jgi:hypothetical protein